MTSLVEATEHQAGPSAGVAGLEDPLTPRLLALYRAATPEQKLTVVIRLNQTLQGLKEAQISAARPDWTSGQRRAALRRWWLSARD